MDIDEEDWLQLSGLQHYAFCKRQWALIYLENQWADNLRTIEGDLLHERAHDEELREKRGDVITVRGLRTGPDKLRLFVGNDSHYYAVTELDLGRPVKSARVATAFPGTQPPVVDTRVCNLRVPRHGMVVVDVEVE